MNVSNNRDELGHEQDSLQPKVDFSEGERPAKEPDNTHHEEVFENENHNTNANSADDIEQLAQQLEFDNDAKLEALDATLDSETEKAAIQSGLDIEQLGLGATRNKNHSSSSIFKSLLFQLLLLSLVLLFIVETALSLQQAWLTSPMLFGLYSFVASLIIFIAAKTTFVEWRKLRRLKHVASQHEIANRLRQSMQIGEADKFINPLLANITPGVDIQRYIELQNDDHNDSEKLVLFERTVVQKQDTIAKKLVSRFAAESALLLAASPLAIVDMAIILWRNQRMINQIAQVYGIELGYWSRIRLIKGIVTNIVYAGTTEIITDLGTQLFSVEMSHRLSARLGQGLGGGLLTARLGYQAMALCRSVPFTTDSRPKLSKIHQQLLAELKRFSVNALRKERNKNLTSID
ncbi:TIGR01620 family protein [Shewanella gelidii]|uniref:UPF0283 membrane protein n=1 Tax=Shewanella gelidii TaxID=1642821 RepID=A0A917JKT8_9GAMM|nr:TIGR01620 family protein [Shewanella gelidii]MCL1097457.1 YcjF family protein [Shewanella gelidii]GGI75321.1 UPF0283 membrane protein [Shewanella gelidii]